MPNRSHEIILKSALRSRAIIRSEDGSFNIVTTNPNLSKAINHIIEEKHLGDTLGDIVTLDDAKRTLEILKRLDARQKIEDQWIAEGGPNGRLGLPIGDEIRAKRTATGFSAEFRSGTLVKPLDTDDFFIEKGEWIQLLFVGVECAVRQEKKDEIYGVVGCFSPATGKTTTVKFPDGNNTITFGPPGQRIWTTVAELYKGPLSDLHISGSLVENDSGDVEEISARLAEQFIAASSKIASTFSGASAEAVTKETWYKEGVGKVFGLILDDIFGIGDDPYDEQAKLIQWNDMRIIPASMSVTHSSDPKIIPQQNFKLTLTGVDDAGDLGVYNLYFLLRPTDFPNRQ